MPADYVFLLSSFLSLFSPGIGKSEMQVNIASCPELMLASLARDILNMRTTKWEFSFQHLAQGRLVFNVKTVFVCVCTYLKREFKITVAQGEIYTISTLEKKLGHSIFWGFPNNYPGLDFSHRTSYYLRSRSGIAQSRVADWWVCTGGSFV